MPYKDNEKQKEYASKHYKKYKKKYRSKVRERRVSNHKFITYCKTNKKCLCGEDDIRCLDFHHKDSSNKLFGIADGVRRGFSQQKIVEEISKCELICANCHRVKHYNPSDSKNINWLRNLRSKIGCNVCGCKNPACLCFHHLRDKKACLTRLASRKYTIDSMIKEIDKCRVLCFNCHRKEHNGNNWSTSNKE